MRLVSYTVQSESRLGAVIDNFIVDLRSASQHILGQNEAHNILFDDLQNMKALLRSDDDTWLALYKIYDTISKEFNIEPSLLINKRILIPIEDIKLRAPMPDPGKVICIAGNFPTPENNLRPEYPTVFMKPSSTITGPGMSVLLSDTTQNVAIEVELGIIVGKTTKHIQAKKALSSIAGYVLANDIGDRVIEKRTSQWTSGKMFDTFTPIGPWLVTKDEIPFPNKLEMISMLNGKVVQKGNTSEMFFSCEEIISYLSDLTTLYPGDIILMGSPKCINNDPNPEVTLTNGDSITIRIEGIGELTNPVKKEQ